MTTAQFVAYIVFSVISLPLIWIRPHKLQKFFYVSVTIVLVFEVSLLIWALATMGEAGFGDTISNKPLTQDTSVGWTILYGIISTIGGISAGILNQNDYARFARRPRDAILGQIISAATYGILSSVVGILVTAATQQRYGEALWNLPTLLSAVIKTGGSRSRAAAFFAGAALVVSQFGINVPGNALSGGFDFAATFPRYINIRRGAYLTALLSPVVNPWQLLATASIFLSVLSSYSVFLGPMIGLMISSYYIVNRQKINVDDLFHGDRRSIYWFTWGINWRAPVAWACGAAPSMPGFISAVNTTINVPIGFTHIYYINFLTGFLIASVVLVGLHWAFPAPSQKEFVMSPTSPKETMAEYQARWDALAEEVETHIVMPKDTEGVMGMPHDI
jgi:NCS1 family nucleobase:cation symporter-1